MKSYNVLTIADNAEFGLFVSEKVNLLSGFSSSGVILLSDSAALSTIEHLPDVVLVCLEAPNSFSEKKLSRLKKRFVGIPFAFVSTFFGALLPEYFSPVLSAVVSGLLDEDVVKTALTTAIGGNDKSVTVEDTVPSLLSFGFDTTSNGFINIAKAVALAETDPFYLSVNELLEQTAKAFGSNLKAVDASSRLSLATAFRRNPEKFSENGFFECPTLVEFINKILKERRVTEI